MVNDIYVNNKEIRNDGEILILKNAIVHITGDNNITLEEIQNCGNGISKLLNKDSNVIWGCEIKEDNKNLVNVFTIFTGVELK